VAAERLRCSPGFVRRLIGRGDVLAIRDGRFVRVYASAVEDYLSRHTIRKGASPSTRATSPAGLHFR
jgi:excisionase family DNA binding protein